MAFNIGENIKKLRAEKGVTQEQLAQHLSITYQSVSKWENNITAPDLYLIPAIAEYFEISTDELFKIDMQGYRNKADRLFSVYEQSGSKEDFEKADAEYEKLFQDNKADDEDMRSYGILNQYRSNALSDKAEELLKQAIELGNKSSEGQLISLLASRGRNKENINKYEEMVKSNPDKIESWFFLISAYNFENLIEKALETAQKGLVKFPDDASLLNQCGDIYSDMQRYDEAFVCWNKSLEQNPKIVNNYYSMAYAYAQLKKYKETIETWEKIIANLEKRGLIEETKFPKQQIAKLQTLIKSSAE